MTTRDLTLLALLLSLALTAVACGEEETRTHHSRFADSTTCASCHQDHYTEWSQSMHAQSGRDPIFRAMFDKGQRDTNGAVGGFCISCHAPMALRTGASENGDNLDELPDELTGIGCVFCHTVDAVEGTDNNPLKLGDPQVLFGAITNPQPNDSHASAYSPLTDRNNIESSVMCGSCHDVKLGSGLLVEKTYVEWQGSLFAHPTSGNGLSCTACHMRGRDARVAGPESPMRRHHDHTLAGVDVPYGLEPGAEGLEEAKAAVDKALEGNIRLYLCVYPRNDGADVLATVENVGAGHSWPSGASHYRRAWVELEAWSGDELVYQNGTIADDEAVPSDDPDMVVLRSHFYDADDNEVIGAWAAVRHRADLLPAPTAPSPQDPAWTNTHLQHRYNIRTGVPDKIVVRAKIRPMAFEVLDELIDSGDLNPEVRDRIPTFTLDSSRLEWRQGDAVDPICP